MPTSLIDDAIRRRNDADQLADRELDPNQRFDRVWVVCDVDEHPNLSAALDKAKANNISVALSDPCFELWYLLHFENAERQWQRAQLGSYVRKLIGYSGKSCPFDKVHTQDRYDAAVKRARDLLRKSKSSAQRNPSTSVFELTALIRTGG